MSSPRGDALKFYGVPSETAHILHVKKERRSIRFQAGARSRETEKQVGEIMQKTIIFIDCGDTIVDERTQVYAGEPENSPVLRADFIPGADEMIRSLYESGHDIVLVADGLVASFENILRENGLYPFFKAKIYSEAIGAGKPSGRMFCAAMGALELTEADKRRIIMVGNNLRRDIKGANAAGITSVFLDWTTRYPKQPRDESEVPDYTISWPLELLPLVEELDRKLALEEKSGDLPLPSNAAAVH